MIISGLSIVLICVPILAVTVDGVVEPGEWAGANVIIIDPNESSVPDNYDVSQIMLEDGQRKLFISISVYGDHPALAAEGSYRPYLDFYFNLYAGGGPVHRMGITYNNGYGFPPDEMHLIRYDFNNRRWEDFGQVDYAIGTAVEVGIPWQMLPPRLISSGPIAVQGLFFLYNVAPGDANNDGTVDDCDLSLLLTNWNTIGGADWFSGDFNLDKCVDDSDLSILLSHFRYQAAGGCTYDIFDEGTIVARNDPLTEHTPEPITLIGVFMGLLGVAGYIRKRRRA